MGTPLSMTHREPYRRAPDAAPAPTDAPPDGFASPPPHFSHPSSRSRFLPTPPQTQRSWPPHPPLAASARLTCPPPTWTLSLLPLVGGALRPAPWRPRPRVAPPLSRGSQTNSQVNSWVPPQPAGRPAPSPVVLRLKELEFLLDAVADLQDRELEGLAGLKWGLGEMSGV